MMASLDMSELMPDTGKENMNRQFENKRWYTQISSLLVSLKRNTSLSVLYLTLAACWDDSVTAIHRIP